MLLARQGPETFHLMSDMPAYVLLLVLYPIVGGFATTVFFLLWPKEHPVWNVSTGPEANKSTTARLGALIPLFACGTLLVGTLFWLLSSPVHFETARPFADLGLSNALVGGYFGFSCAGISIWLLALGVLTGRMRREIPGLMAPLRVQIVVWLAEAVAEETWRVTALLALTTSGSSTVSSLAVVSLAYGSGFLRLGPQRAAVASLEGFFFGFLFSWRGSFLAPIAAHLAVQAVYIWGIGDLSQYRQRRKTWQIPGTKCPVCQAHLKLLQIKLSDLFECPSCGAQLSVSDAYQNVMRFIAALGFGSIILGTLLLLHLWLPDKLVYCLTYPVSYGFMTSGFLLYKKAFTRLFPPRLQRGTPYLITLNLNGGRESKTSKVEEKEQDLHDNS